MMIHRQHPTVDIPPWDPPYDDPSTPIFSPQTNDYFAALKRYLPSSEFDDSDNESSDLPFDSFTCDNFRMYEFKIRKCVRGRSHDWTECPYAHPGEKARRRDPRKFHYSGTACPEFRRGSCRKGDSCEYAHGVFECWLHPARYRTQPCKDGPHCKRRVCFFAHSPEQLRVLPSLSTESPPIRLGYDSVDEVGLGGGSGLSSYTQEQLRVLPPLPESPPSYGRLGSESMNGFVDSPPMKLGFNGYSPTSVFDSFPDSPPMSPRYASPNSVNELSNAMRGLQLGKLGVGPRNLWGVQMGSPRSPRGFVCGSSCSGVSGGLCGGGSLPTTPTRNPTRSGLGLFDLWDVNIEEEVPMERVESGNGLRARMYAKLCKENSLDHDRVNSVSPGPDFGWVSELIK